VRNKHLVPHDREQFFAGHTRLPKARERGPHLIEQLGTCGVLDLLSRRRNRDAGPIVYDEESLAF
jgi:hypothetical protein